MKNIFASIVVATSILCLSLTALAQTETNNVKKATIKVSNLHCNGDMPTIKKQLLNQDGVEDVTFTDISGESSTFTVTYHSAATSQAQIEKTIETTPGCDDKNEMPYKINKEGSSKKKKS